VSNDGFRRRERSNDGTYDDRFSGAEGSYETMMKKNEEGRRLRDTDGNQPGDSCTWWHHGLLTRAGPKRRFGEPEIIRGNHGKRQKEDTEGSKKGRSASQLQTVWLANKESISI